ncbi:DUF4033 domain-containing protein [Cyanobacterium stanieri LEGE 03274]|uniref:DUF4033 domain-containing protein n=1 Tax=Cyanobacterium stanieri LEGE 03274 TaxID=1828756 RepID=A0ABR9V7Q6_9CHRO|nr:DUF4033 domain-containing protein [Cyanobacterium stanieri]MBE9222859.1 DUF4033 domain-containing protein [Cyanobacterium stanieri LEGE 03274]
MQLGNSNITEKTTYQDNLIDRLFIALFCRKMAKAVGEKTTLKGYDGFVELSQKIMKGRNPQQQQELVAIVLKSLVPSPVLYFTRTFIPANKWVCEANAWFAKVLFQWLVGVCELREVEIEDKNHQKIIQNSGVHIKKCRYLENSGCVAMCINMCKLPTQKFFTDSFGIPVTLTPNFEDFSCEMVFGQNPPPLHEEDASRQPCLKEVCDSSKTSSFNNSSPCPKIAQQISITKE